MVRPPSYDSQKDERPKEMLREHRVPRLMGQEGLRRIPSPKRWEWRTSGTRQLGITNQFTREEASPREKNVCNIHHHLTGTRGGGELIGLETETSGSAAISNASRRPVISS